MVIEHTLFADEVAGSTIRITTQLLLHTLFADEVAGLSHLDHPIAPAVSITTQYH